MRAAEASKNTAGLIEDTVKRVKDGGELVDRTNQAFSKVTDRTGKIGELVGEIAAASNEQAEGIEQVNKAVAEMDKVVQQNAANAEESASASEEMNAQAVQMRKYVADMTTMVGGNNADTVRGPQEPTISHSMPPTPNLAKSASINSKGEIASFEKKGFEVRPEKLIPMEEDDFKHF